MSSRTSPLLVTLGAVVLLLSVAGYAAVSRELIPRITEGIYRVVPNGAWQPYAGTLPPADGTQLIDVEFNLVLRTLHATSHQLIADDCVEKLEINAQAVGQDIVPFCDYARGRTLDLKRVLHAGPNKVSMTIQNVGGPASFNWRISWLDPLLLTLRILLVLGILLSTFLFMKGFALSKVQNLLLGTFSFGVLLRLVYVFATSYEIRAYDADGHLEYTRYVAEHLALPAIRDGWEFYQAPLYYIVTGLWMRAGMEMGRALPLLTRDIQWIALFSSVLALAGMAWIATLLFARKEKTERILFLASAAVLPSIVFVSARVNNDVFLLLMEVFCFAFLLKWWQTGRWRHWWLSLLLLALAILSKTNALLLLPPVFLLLVCRRRLPLKTKALTGALSLLLLTLLVGWIFTLRNGASLSQPLVVNTGNLSSGLYVQNTIETFTEFNPLRMALRPYNNPWDDGAGRQYFWEYFFKSAFFGEFDFGETLKPLAIAVLVCAFLALLYAVYGAWVSIRKDGWRTLPVWGTAGFLLLGHALHRAITPHSCAQDFRFSLLLSLPVIFFVIQGIRSLRSPLLKSVGMVVVLTGIALQVVFLMGIIVLF